MIAHAKVMVASTVVVLALTIALRADPPSDVAKPPHIANRTFIPNAGYSGLAAAAHLARRASERGIANFAPGQPLSVVGTRALPVICVSFKNVSAPFPASQYETLLFGSSNPTSITRYYSDMSLGKLTVAGRVAGWYDAPKDDTFYENGSNGDGVPFGQLLEFALKKADQELDFGQFDNDGRDGLPNSGDDDGKVDTVFFIHPESGGECGGTNIWSHSWHYSEPSYGHSGPFVTKALRRDSAGHETSEHIVVEDYTIQPGLACESTPAAKKIVEVGVYCHEYGHALGLPDFYDRTPSPQADSEGVGNWCLMAGGSYGGDGQHAERPGRMGAWCLYYLGWATLDTIGSDDDLDLDPASVRNDIKRLMIPNTNDLEYILLEYRKNGSGPAGKVNWDEFLPKSGLAVWHVDERVGGNSPSWPFAELNKGQNDSPIRLNLVPPPIFKSKHPLVALIQADGKMHLENANNRGDATDIFVSGQQLADDATGKVGTRGYDGMPTGIEVTSIQVDQNSVKAKIKLGTSTPAVHAIAAPPLAQSERSTSLSKVSEKLQAALETESVESGQLKQSDLEKLLSALDPTDVAALKKATATEIGAQIPSGSAYGVRALSARLRTKELTAGNDGAAASDAEKAAKSLLSQSKNAQSAKIMYGHDSAQVCQVTGLNLDPVAATPGRDAKERLANQDVASLLGGRKDFRQITEDPTSRRQEFEQMWKVGGKRLPVWGAVVALNYDDDDHLTSLAAQPSPVLEQVEGANATLTDYDAIAVVADGLGLAKNTLRPAGEYVYSDDATAKIGRVAKLVTGYVGNKEMKIFVDASTRKILAVR